MHFCVNGRQPYSIIARADEVRFSANDKDRILDLVEKYPNKIVILEVSNEEVDWSLLKAYSEKFKDFYIALYNLNRAQEFNDAGIKWYWVYPITSYYELGLVMEMGPSYIFAGPPLTFDLVYLRERVGDIPVRMVANVARPKYIPSCDTDGICGQWVRPEDVDTYAEYIDCLEFDEVDLKQEEILLHIYKENGKWPGNLNLIINKLNFNVDNRAIPEELVESRIVCGQRCWKTGTCRLCNRAFQFADQIRKEAQSRR